MKTIDINNLVRKNIRDLKPYQSARDELSDNDMILLDANENPFPVGYNRYPDPLQRKLKDVIAKQKNILAENIFLGNGSDEIIDLLIRAFCNPAKDSILINIPTYGMYEVCAKINDINIVKVNLDNDFQINLDEISANLSGVKIIFICSPNNPTGNRIKREKITTLLESFNGIIVVDEAYIDFANKPSLINELSKYPNLVILQTFSKARAMAGIRLGIAFASAQIIEILTKIKYPYNVSQLNQDAAIKALQYNSSNYTIQAIISQKEWIIEQLYQLDIVAKIWPSDANFLLVKFYNHKKVFDLLKKLKIVVRDRSNEPNCYGCLRITIGTSTENKTLIESLKKIEKSNLKEYEKNTIS